MSRADKTFWFCLLCAVVLLASCNRSKANNFPVPATEKSRCLSPIGAGRQQSQSVASLATFATTIAAGNKFVSGGVESRHAGTSPAGGACWKTDKGIVQAASRSSARPADKFSPAAPMSKACKPSQRDAAKNPNSPCLKADTDRGFISDRLLDAIARIESSGNPKAIGDGGKARGMFQLHRAAWEDARSLETQSNVVAKSQLIGDYETGSIDPARARLAARLYLTNLAARFQRATSRTPTPAELYAAYNLGFAGFSKRGFDLKRCPKTTQQAIKKLEKML